MDLDEHKVSVKFGNTHFFTVYLSSDNFITSMHVKVESFISWKLFDESC